MLGREFPQAVAVLEGMRDLRAAWQTPRDFPGGGGRCETAKKPAVQGVARMGARTKGNPPRKRGPKPERLVLPGRWEENVGEALNRRPPEGGWPKPKKKGRGK